MVSFKKSIVITHDHEFSLAINLTPCLSNDFIIIILRIANFISIEY